MICRLTPLGTAFEAVPVHCITVYRGFSEIRLQNKRRGEQECGRSKKKVCIVLSVYYRHRYAARAACVVGPCSLALLYTYRSHTQQQLPKVASLFLFSEFYYNASPVTKTSPPPPPLIPPCFVTCCVAFFMHRTTGVL